MWRGLLELLSPSLCPSCDTPRGEDQPLLCASCRRDLEPWLRLGSVHTAIAYRGTGRRLIQRFKFEGRRAALDVLIGALERQLRELDFDVVVPIPRHRQRLAEQRRDPVHALACSVSRRLGRPVADALERTRPTQLQVGLHPDERRRNVAGSFGVRKGALTDRRVLLLDDVATTGATLTSAAEVLQEQGRAAHVECAALAATPPVSAPLSMPLERAL